MLGLGMEDMTGQGGDVLCGSPVQGPPGIHHCRVGALVNNVPQVRMWVVTQRAWFAMGSSTEIMGSISRVCTRVQSYRWLPPGGGIRASREGEGNGAQPRKC